MSWKYWPSWLKGGILIFVPVILFVIYGILRGISCFGGSKKCLQFFDTSLRLFLLPFNKILFFLPSDSSGIIVFPLIVIYIFIIGAIIGWIIGKIKSKKQVQQNQVITK